MKSTVLLIAAAVASAQTPYDLLLKGGHVIDAKANLSARRDVAIQQGSDVIAAVGFEMPTRRRMNSYTAVTTHFNSLYMNNILKSTFAFYNAVHHAEIIPILPDFERPVGTFDTAQIPYIIAQGEKATEQHIPYIKQLVAVP